MVKTKIFKFLEWNKLAREDKVKESDLKNGHENHLPIECPGKNGHNCKAKIWQTPKDPNNIRKPGSLWPVGCHVCHWDGYRVVARE